jgi:hypothetical protein
MFTVQYKEERRGTRTDASGRTEPSDAEEEDS